MNALKTGRTNLSHRAALNEVEPVIAGTTCGCKILPSQMEENHVLIIHLEWKMAGAELVEFFQLIQLSQLKSALVPSSVSSRTQLSQLWEPAHPADEVH
ncbi:hypothetical protein PGTUg99_036232 [Puccinia graminis f. sp. tritici]|uniref:Uncharacterized protein n=1 Tax=Puccinia graminis f. sp. tritici TaxID=56615 RepID=A0A5B0P335_PUCGR|nr:hypothetical protein PGTUg99_036232 [Puccinia graminis f. sp. tritici]